MVTTDDMKTLVGLLKPVIKAELEAGSTGVGTLEAVSSLEGVYSLPALRRQSGAVTAVEAPISLLKGEDGERGDSLEYRLLDSYPSLEALKAAYPSGTPENGFFIAGEGMYVWNPREGAFKEISLDVDKVFTSEVFTEVSPSGDKVSIDFSATPYAKVSLGQERLVYDLDIRGTREGSRGKVMVYQTGLRQLTMGGRLRGTVDLPLNADTIAILSYNRVGEHVYVHTATVIGDRAYPAPQRVVDFQVTYSDSSSCTLQWTAPYANNIYDKGTAYDMRYANDLVDADDPKVWAGLKRVAGVPVPARPGTLQKTTLQGLSPGKEHLVYLKTVRVNSGLEYASPASDPAYFRTLGRDDPSRAYRIPLSERNLYPQLSNYNSDVDGSACSIGRMVDETDANAYLPDGYPDTSNKGYATFWSAYKYGRDTSPFDIVIDLLSPYALDRLFVYSRGKPSFSVYGMRDTGHAWERVGEISIAYNAWASLDFGSLRCRYVRLSFDRMDFGSSSTPPLAEGAEGFPEPEYNGTLDRIDNLLLYGRPVSGRPDGIMSPSRRSTRRRTVDQFLCTNGHAYQQGRIHSMCSGEKVRLYIHFGQFATLHGTPEAYSSLSGMRFRTDAIPWVSGNNGTGAGLADTLRDTYARHGLRPYLCNTGVFDYCYRDRASSQHNRPCDAYWYPGAWRPAPRRGVGGLERYHGVTTSPSSYGTYAKLCQAVATRYGSAGPGGEGLFWPPESGLPTGLGLISGIEPENEPDQGWSGWIGYTRAEEYAAIVSASSDGHGGSLLDEEGVPLGGARSGGVLSVASGLSSVNRGYLLPALLHWRATRADASLPADALSMHMYFSNAGNQGDSQAAVQYGIPLEEALGNVTGGELPRVCALRDRLAPDRELWLTEFGWGESGARDTRSKYQCYSQPGRYVGGWLIPDRHRSDVKGAWIVRACVQLMAMGFDLANHYSTECEGNYFDAGQWGSGAGDEMFRWDDCVDTTPGAKVEAVKPYECGYARGGFATTGLFGQLLGNGAYPITRAYWWVATFRNRLKGYVYTGMRYLERDERIVVACFRKPDEERGAYVVYYNDSRNTGLEGVEIPLPEGVSRYARVRVHVPRVPDPWDVPPSLGWDRERTGLPTSRKERYVNGEWVVQNKPYYKDRHMSYSKAPADYPADPAEGDEVTVLPTRDENPWFPIVGPVWARSSPRGNTLSAKQYERDREDWEDGPELDGEGNVAWRVKEDPAYSWRQVDAACDYIDLHPDGVRGAHGDEETLEAVRGMIRANVSEFPEFYLFDAAPDPDYRGEVTDLSSRTVSSSAVELWWNNTGVEDTGYEIFVSSLPETGYALLLRVGADVENRATIPGLSPGTTYYLKVRPVKGGKAGTLSGSVSARTYRDMAPPSDLRVEGRAATSVRLSWDYPPSQAAGFVRYDLLRAEGGGSFVAAGSVEDQSVLSYEDTGLAVGRAYRYKARAVGLDGVSPCAGPVETRTLLPEEVSPVPRSASTDKLGVRVTLGFDLPLGDVPAAARGNFRLTEDGNDRLVLSVSPDAADPRRLVLSLPQDSLSDHDRRTDLRVSYDGLGGISSAYGVPLSGFRGERVVNRVGNFTGLEATYRLNLRGPSAPPSQGPVSARLSDTYGRESAVTATSALSRPSLDWAGTLDSGYCEIPGVEPAVYRNGWRGPGFGSDAGGRMVARLLLSGLEDTRRYTVRAFGGTTFGSPLPTRLRSGEAWSGTLDLKGNKASFLTLEDLAPSGGSIAIDIVNATEGPNTAYPFVSFLEIDEFRPSDEPPSDGVFLRSAEVPGAVDGVVRLPDVTVRLACVGVATSCRVWEDGGMDAAAWSPLGGVPLEARATLSAGFGPKRLYVQARNAVSESNVRTVDLEYRDPYVPLVLRNAYVNGDAGRTHSREVTVTLDKEGVPSHYRASESPDLPSVPWAAWPDPSSSSFPFTLSEGAGRKTVYVQAMDASTVSQARADTIDYAPLSWRRLTLSVTVPEGVDPSGVTASFPALKFGKRFIFSYTADDGPVGAYGKAWSAANGKWVDDERHYHLGQERSTGYVPERTLGYTDGCGRERRLPVGVAIWPNCGNATTGTLMDKEREGRYYPYIIWPELPPILDFGGSVYFHNVDQDRWGRDDPSRVLEGLREDQAKTLLKLGVGMKVMMRPDGNNTYLTAAAMYDDIAMSFGENRPAVPLYPGEDPDLWKAVGERRIYRDDNAEGMAWVRSIRESGRPMWAHLFTHTPLQGIVDLLTMVSGAYGKDGDDSCWMATVDEVYEYWFTRRNARVTREVSGRTVRFLLEVPVDRYFYHGDLSLSVGGVTSLGGVAVEPGGDVLGMSYGLVGGCLMVNLDHDPSLLERAGRYVAAFEATEGVPERDDALYFVGRLLEPLRAPFLARIGAVTSPPVLLSLSVAPRGADEREVSLVYEASGRVTRRAVSESPAFEGAGWEEAGPGPAPFLLSAVAGEREVHLKVGNAWGESLPMSVTVPYAPPAFALRSISINGGRAVTRDPEVSVSFDTRGLETPDMAILSESPAFGGAGWVPYENPARLVLSGRGPVSVHARVRAGSLEGGPVSASITVDTAESVLLGTYSWAASGQRHVIYDARLGSHVSIYAPFDSTVYGYRCHDEATGELKGDWSRMAEAEAMSYYGLPSNARFSAAKGMNPDLSSVADTPLEYYYIYKYDSTAAAALGWRVPPGTYRVSLLSSSSSPSDRLSAAFGHVEVNGVALVLPDVPTLDNTVWVESGDVAVGDGRLCLGMWTERNRKIGLNAIRIRRL